MSVQHTVTPPAAAFIHATSRTDSGEWWCLTMDELRRFIEDHAHAAGDAVIVAVTRHGTDEVRGVGFVTAG